MPDAASSFKRAFPPLSDAGKAAYAMIRDSTFEKGAAEHAEIVQGIGALFNQPIFVAQTKRGKDLYVNTVSPISQHPKLAIEEFLEAAAAIEKMMRPEFEMVVTRFGAFSGMSQQAAQNKIKESISVLRDEVRIAFPAQYHYVEEKMAATRQLAEGRM